MKRRIRIERLVVAGVAAAAMAVGPLASAAGAALEGPAVPDRIAVPDGNKVFLVGHAIDVQIYSCNATTGRPTWGFVAPRANLYDDGGKVIATHFGGPTWQAKDGSSVKGQRVDGVTVDPTAIPWLLLSAASTTSGPDGDRLTDTTFLQRTATSGGLAPAAAECKASSVGTTVEVPYTADYHFWKATGA